MSVDGDVHIFKILPLIMRTRSLLLFNGKLKVRLYCFSEGKIWAYLVHNCNFVEIARSSGYRFLLELCLEVSVLAGNKSLGLNKASVVLFLIYRRNWKTWKPVFLLNKTRFGLKSNSRNVLLPL